MAVTTVMTDAAPHRASSRRRHRPARPGRPQYPAFAPLPLRFCFSAMSWTNTFKARWNAGRPLPRVLRRHCLRDDEHSLQPLLISPVIWLTSSGFNAGRPPDLIPLRSYLTNSIA